MNLAIDPKFEHWKGDVIIAAEEPSVKHVEKHARIPAAWLVEPDRYGEFRDIIDYLAHVNAVPQHVNVETSQNEATRDVDVRFSWWEITALVTRPER